MTPTYIHPNLKQLSNSTNVTLHKCPRKFELDKLMKTQSDNDDFHLVFGSLVGIGIAEIMESGSWEKAYWKMFLCDRGNLDDDFGSIKNKTFYHALIAIDRFLALRNSRFRDYELAYFDGKPATELGFTIDCGNGFSYRGFIDAVLLNRITKEIVVLECKTTSFSNIHEAVFKHSGQAIGYSIIIDTMVSLLNLDESSSYTVFYPIYKATKGEWELMEFRKNHVARALWIKNILLDKQFIEERAADNYFPMRGESCYDFFRPCEYFEVCEMANKNLFGDVEKVKERVEADDKYQFKFSLEELIEAQLEKM